jgi:hypothetical protein
MIDGTKHSIATFILQGSTSTPHFLTPMVLDLMLRLWMDSSHVFRGWCQVSKKVRRFPRNGNIWMFGVTFGFDVAIHDRKTKMSGKLH